MTDQPDEPDTCRSIELDDGTVIRVRGGRGEWTDADRAAMAAIVRAVHRRYEAEHGSDE